MVAAECVQLPAELVASPVRAASHESEGASKQWFQNQTASQAATDQARATQDTLNPDCIAPHAAHSKNDDADAAAQPHAKSESMRFGQSVPVEVPLGFVEKVVETQPGQTRIPTHCEFDTPCGPKAEEMSMKAFEETGLRNEGRPIDHFKVGDVCKIRHQNGAKGRVAEDMDSTDMWVLPDGCTVTVVEIGTGPSGRRVCVKDDTGRCGWISVVTQDGASILLPAACLPRELRWEVNVGPLQLKRDGVALKPQFKIGGEFEKMRLEAGISDLRDGLRVTANVASTWECTAVGHSLAELHRKVRFDAPGIQQALQASQKLLEATRLSQCPELAWAMQKKPETLAEMMAALPVEEGRDDRLMSLRVQVQAKIGVTARLNLGWRDTQGYHMVGVGGSVSSAIKIGANLFAGIHSSKASARVLVGISSFTFQYTFPLPKREVALGTHKLSLVGGNGWANDFLVMASARSVAELHEDARTQQEAPGFFDAVDTAAAVLNDSKGVAGKIATSLGLTTGQLQDVLHARGCSAATPELLLKVHAEELLAASSEQRLARCCTHGLSFQRIPVDAKTAVKASATVLGVLVAGHPGEESGKVILFLGNFTFEYVFSLELAKLDLRQRANSAFKSLLR